MLTIGFWYIVGLCTQMKWWYSGFLEKFDFWKLYQDIKQKVVIEWLHALLIYSLPSYSNEALLALLIALANDWGNIKSNFIVEIDIKA